MRRVAKTERAEGRFQRFQVKVGLTGIGFPSPRVGQPLTFRISPVSYWFLSEFNRRILRGDKVLHKIHRERLQEALAIKDSVRFDTPCFLYVEPLLITADDKVVVVEKNPGLSALARTGRRFTCGFEEGLRWNFHVADGHVDLIKAAYDGVGQELELEARHIVSVEFYGVAIEMTHLNAAVLGAMHVSVESRDLEGYIKKSNDFLNNKFFIKKEDVLDRLFLGQEFPSNSWHPTARLRLLLFLYRTYGDDVVRRALAALGP